MARPRRRLAAAFAAVLLLAVALRAPAFALRALHVDALSMRADRAQLRVGQVFHLAIHAHVREQLTALDELVVPDVGTMQLEGDERHVTASASGTDVVETLTLEPTQSGAFTFNGAYLDAVDARTHKPSRFSANAVRVVVERPNGFGDAWWSAARVIGAIALAGLVLFVAIAALVAVFGVRRRRRAATVPPAQPVVAPPSPPRTPRDDVVDALRAYRTSPANGSLMRLRGALFVAAGANAGSTLRDAVAATSDRALRDALVAAEHTAFGPAHVRDAASDDLIGATEAWLR
ncbi:MAG: hypothetical protein QOJ39_350 [Candidatus Eremiobacteraeota bacterium]|jgi:hypothetical protein|nr:hypothetical protein [Candidatus Eremiobacteraeota bacterium]